MYSNTMSTSSTWNSSYISSSETQGQIKGARESLNRRKNVYGTKKSKEQREEPLGTMSYQTSSKWSPPFCLLIGAKKNLCFSGTNQKPERRRPFGTGLVRHCPKGLFSPFFTFLRVTFFRPFRLSLVPTICPWVSEDAYICRLKRTNWSWLESCRPVNLFFTWNFVNCLNFSAS